MAKSFVCRFCNHAIVVTSDNSSLDSALCRLPSKFGTSRLLVEFTSCPNPACEELQIEAKFCIDAPKGVMLVEKWDLRPSSFAKTFPEYVPAPIIEDYVEATKILKLSPKASASLSRRCLQGMIRDFWGIQRQTLKGEIDALEEKVSEETWLAIDGLRQIGNIGAHMEKDINTIIEVDPEEAELLVGLIETLIEDWYVNRHNRQERFKKITAAATSKKEAKTTSRT